MKAIVKKSLTAIMVGVLALSLSAAPFSAASAAELSAAEIAQNVDEGSAQPLTPRELGSRIILGETPSSEIPDIPDTSETPSVDASKFLVVSSEEGAAGQEANEIAEALDEKLGVECNAEELSSTVSVVEAAGAETSEEALLGQASDIADNCSEEIHVMPVRRYRVSGVSEYSRREKDYPYLCPSEQGETFGYIDNDKMGHLDEHGGGASTVKPYFMAKKTGRTATVAVIDTGCRTTHKMLAGKVLTQYAYNAYTNKRGVAAIADVIDHGTSVASVIACNENFSMDGNEGLFKTGVCANTKILPIKACEDVMGMIDDESILRALLHVEDLVSSGKVNDLRVVNMSFGAHCSAELAEACGFGDIDSDPLYAQIKKLHDDYGIICVGAAGNEFDNGIIGGFEEGGDGYDFPADYDCCISVMASASFDTNAYFTNAGPGKDISAPGTCIVGATSVSDTAYSNELSGTSFSAPIIAGALSTMIQINPNLSVDDAKRLLCETATPFTVMHKKFHNCIPRNGGAGMANIEKAVWLDYRQRGKVTQYWDGMSDGVRIKGALYGFKVLSAKNKTVAVTALGPTEKSISQISFPEKVKLGDGLTYKVTTVAIGMSANHMHDVQKTPVVFHSGISALNEYAAADWEGEKLNFIVRTKKFTKKTVQEGCLSNVALDTITVDVSKAHHRYNRQYVAAYKKLLNYDYAYAGSDAKFRTLTKAAKIKKAKIRLAKKTYRYTGKKIKPVVKVKYGSKKLRRNIDYKVSYKKNKKAGKAKVIVRGIGDYAGTKKLSFKIKKK